jgi:hypothetical protein
MSPHFIDGEVIARQVIPVRRLKLRRQIVKALRGAKAGKVKNILKRNNIAHKFAQSSLGKAYTS